MIEINNIEVFNFEGALRGMRNPMDSWEKSDTVFFMGKGFNIGEKDLALAQKLINGGPVHSKFMRQIFVSMDIDAPFYWWKEMDTYKVGTTANSCSTMHRITSKPITRENFSFDEELDDLSVTKIDQSEVTEIGRERNFVAHRHIEEIFDTIITYCEELRKEYLKTKDKRYWSTLIKILPEGWNQKRTWTADYETLRNIYQWRRGHKLDEWHDFCHMIEELPYGKELICYNIGGNENEA